MALTHVVWMHGVVCSSNLRSRHKKKKNLQCNINAALIWAVSTSDVLQPEWNMMTCVLRNAWMCVCCVQSVGCPWRLTTCMRVHSCFHQCPDASSMLYWWPVCGTPEDTSSDVASCRFLPGWSRVGQSSHAPRKRKFIHIIIRIWWKTVRMIWASEY